METVRRKKVNKK